VSRRPRLIVRNLPHHVVHRGHNRDRIFRLASDYRWYLHTLRQLASGFAVHVYAYCLMSNHVHLVLNPGDSETSIPALMKRLAGRHTRRTNRIERRTGTLWDARYYSSPIETDSYLLACCRYVELNPVRAGIVKSPDDYPWSSYRQRVEADAERWVTLDPSYLGLGASPEQRCRAYREWVNRGVGAELDVIRAAINRSQLTGDASFVDQIELVTGRRIDARGRGRPRRARPAGG
jgi:putative transposase